MTVHLRAHHLLCILTYVGKGYSSAFTDNMTVIAGRISAGEMIRIVEGPDDICASRWAETDAHCCEDRIRIRDMNAAADVGRVLQISVQAGATLSLDKYSLKRLRAAFTEGQIRSACKDCQWNELCTIISKNSYIGTMV